jgi:RsiW-degrading membrane proteinase PrsW (M82 family)
MIEAVLHILIGVLPVGTFLGALVLLDSYKLVKLQDVLLAIAAGCLAAFVAMILSAVIGERFGFDERTYSRFGAPVLEEALKVSFIVYLFARKRIGFMVDGAIYGFAIGTGFAFVENVYYVQHVTGATPGLWVIRGFGTALMHGGTTAIVGIIAKSSQERGKSLVLAGVLPGILLAFLIHGSFNQFYVTPLVSTLLMLVGLPLVMYIVYQRSSRSVERWLGVGFDTDRELLEMVTTGHLAETKVGLYLQSLQDRFAGQVVADMLCYLRVRVELSIKAKGMLLLREAGFTVETDPDVHASFDELRYLEKSIGKTGLLALRPFVHGGTQDLWQLYLLQSQG